MSFNASVCSLTGSNASVCSLTGINASVCSLTGSNASVCSLTGINASVCSLTGINASVCSLTGSNASVCSLTGSSASVCSLTGSNASVCSLTGSNASVCSLTGSSVSGVKPGRTLQKLLSGGEVVEPFWTFALKRWISPLRCNDLTSCCVCSLLLQQSAELLHRALRCPGFLQAAVLCYTRLLQLVLDGHAVSRWAPWEAGELNCASAHVGLEL